MTQEYTRRRWQQPAPILTSAPPPARPLRQREEGDSTITAIEYFGGGGAWYRATLKDENGTESYKVPLWGQDMHIIRAAGYSTLTGKGLNIRVCLYADWRETGFYKPIIAQAYPPPLWPLSLVELPRPDDNWYELQRERLTLLALIACDEEALLGVREIVLLCGAVRVKYISKTAALAAVQHYRPSLFAEQELIHLDGMVEVMVMNRFGLEMVKIYTPADAERVARVVLSKAPHCGIESAKFEGTRTVKAQITSADGLVALKRIGTPTVVQDGNVTLKLNLTIKEAKKS